MSKKTRTGKLSQSAHIKRKIAEAHNKAYEESKKPKVRQKTANRRRNPHRLGILLSNYGGY